MRIRENRRILVTRRPPVQTRAGGAAAARNVSWHGVECRKNIKFHPRIIFSVIFINFHDFSMVWLIETSSKIMKNHENPSKNDSGVKTIIFPALYTIQGNVSRGRSAPSARLNLGAPRDKNPVIFVYFHEFSSFGELPGHRKMTRG